MGSLTKLRENEIATKYDLAKQSEDLKCEIKDLKYQVRSLEKAIHDEFSRRDLNFWTFLFAISVGTCGAIIASMMVGK